MVLPHSTRRALIALAAWAPAGSERNSLSEAALSFLGLGVGASHPTWGGMLNDGCQFRRQAWWHATFPGLAISALVLSINLLGDGLRDALDPRLRGR
jgi:peptide/nickel transport system permease protein